MKLDTPLTGEQIFRYSVGVLLIFAIRATITWKYGNDKYRDVRVHRVGPTVVIVSR